MCGMAPVNGVFREVSGHGTVSPGGEVSGTVTVASRPSTRRTSGATGTCTAIGRNVRGGRPILRADVAHYMLAILDQPETIGQAIGIAT